MQGRQAEEMKVCDECGGKHYAKGKCKVHYKMPSQLSPKPIKRNTSPQTGPKQKSIAKVSQKQLDRLKAYRRARDAYFKKNPVCEFPGCSSREIDLHHKRGRVGAFLTDKRWFCSLCRPHHNWVEMNPSEAQKMGLSLKRLDKFQ